jgi:hypothetical protein
MSEGIGHLGGILRSLPWKGYAYAAVAYLLIALVLFYPLTLNLRTMTPGSGADSYQNLWDIWWVNYALFNLHTSIYYTYLLFWPIGVNLVYQTMSPLLALVSAPFQAVGVVFAYNIVFLLSFVLSGLGMMLLAKYITRNSYAAFFAGIVFTFSSFHIAQAYAHIHFINIMFVPLFMYFLLKSVREGRRSDVLGMAASFAFSALVGSTEQTLMLALLFVFVVAAYLIFGKDRKRILSVRFASNLALFVVLSFIIGVWLFLPVANALLHGGTLASVNYLNDVQHNEMWSSDLLSFFVPSYYNGIFSWLTKGTYSTVYADMPTERIAYLSFTALFLAIYCVYRQRGRAALWLAGAVVFGLLSLGPYIEVGGNVTTVPSLYYVYHVIPYINIIREPGRFNLITTMFFAILAALGVELLLERGDADKKGVWHNKLLVVGALSFLFLLESNGMPLNSQLSQLVSMRVSVPQLYTLLAAVPGNFSILQLPAVSSSTALSIGKATYYTSITHRPLVGGYVTRSNSTDTMILYNIPLVLQGQSLIEYGNMSYESPVVENYTNQTLLTLFNYNTEFVVLDKSAFNSTSLAKMVGYLEGVFGAPVYNDNSTLAFVTANAINSSIFRSFVSYPILTQWQTTLIPFNGTYRQVWVPIESGAIIVYAPYASATSAESKVNPSAYYGVNTTIRLNALSVSPQTLYIAEPVGNTTKTIAQLNLTDSLQSYDVNVTLTAGPIGNTFFFVTSDQHGTAAIMNITFSRRVP